jgi:hypothetical protein
LFNNFSGIKFFNKRPEFAEHFIKAATSYGEVKINFPEDFYDYVVRNYDGKEHREIIEIKIPDEA